MAQQLLRSFLTEKQINQDLIHIAESSLTEFTQLDTSKDGRLCLDEFKKVPGVSADAERIFKIMDLDCNQHISKEEYVKYRVMDKLTTGLIPKFKEMDVNKDGTLTIPEVTSFLKAQGYDCARTKSFIEMADKNNDGKVDYMELAECLHKM